MKKVEKMQIINPHACGIDVGSKSHYVAVGQNQEDVKEFGVYSSDYQKIVCYLKENNIKTIAMESTGSYWQSLFMELQNAGFEVFLVSGQQTKNVRAKTDVKDCQWIQKLHSLGLLRGCFLPDEHTLRVRTLNRHRQSLIEESAKLKNKMQKALRLCNFRIDVVINDITGKSGQAIIEAILSGERDGNKLSQLADSRVRKSKKEIAEALKGHNNDELMYELGDCYDLYKIIQSKIDACDKKIEQLLKNYLVEYSHKDPRVKIKQKQTKGKNQVKFDLPQLSYQYYGVDLFAIESVSMNTVLTLITEIGKGIYKFKTAKQFTSFLRLAPNNKISGGKLISSRTPKGANRLSVALRNAANTIDRIKEGTLVSFFKRIAYKKGRCAAITATARKLAVIIWNMIVKKQQYKPIDEEVYKELIKIKVIKKINHQMKKLNIITADLLTT